MEKLSIGYSCSISWSELNKDQKERFKQALFESKGQANNQIGAILAITGAPVKDIVKYATKVQGAEVYAKRPRSKFTAKDRVSVFASKLVPDFWDTVKGKKLKAKGEEALKRVGLNPSEPLPASRLDVRLSEKAIQLAYKLSGDSYLYNDALRALRYDSILAGKVKAVEVFEPLAKVKFMNDDAVNKLRSCTDMSDDVKMPDYHKYRKYEIESLSKIDAAVAEHIAPIEMVVDTIRNNYGYCFGRSSKYSVEVVCVIEAFYAVCEELGIVGVLDRAVQGRLYVSSAAMLGIMKNVIKLSAMYRRLVKSGFAESVARETVLAEINENIAKRATRPVVRFYGRTDYKDTPEEERVKAKVKTTSSGTGRGGKKSVMSIEDFAKANGLGLTTEAEEE